MKTIFQFNSIVETESTVCIWTPSIQSLKGGPWLHAWFPVMTIKSSSTSWIINTRYAQGKQKMFKVPVARPFEVAVNPLFLRCFILTARRVCGSGEARVCHLHARSIFLTLCAARIYVYSINSHLARRIMSARDTYSVSIRTWHYFSARDDALMSARICDLYFTAP